ncbi:lipase [Brucella abortus]|uniref:lipase n=1 Tax=Brucella abortus TaxID=235 RepID=UPI0008DAE5DA|nr:lipase [Brucella abortus]OHX89434.1 lipase [Brucella abortus]
MQHPVRRRAIFFIGGYDPKTPEAFFNRLLREIARFGALWDVKTQVSPVSENASSEIGSVTIETRSAEGWSTQTDFNFLVLDKIVLADFARPLPVRLWKYLVAFADFVLSGTAFRFFARAWRFALYFLYPFLALVLFALAGWLAARLTAPWLGLAGWIVGLFVFFLALATLGNRWSTNHLMDLWSFSRDFMRGQRPDAEALMQRFAEEIDRRVAAGHYDEVIVIGHSTGGMLMLDVAARCLAADRAFATRAPKVVLLTLGSTALKAGYHPAAGKFRQDVQRLVDEPALEWCEVQCLTDVINFYKTDPVAEMKLKRPADRAFPLVRQVRIKDMLQPDIYRRIKRNFFRVHYQYVFGNTKAYWYDFFQICCGPASLSERMRDMLVGTAKESAQQ